MQRASIREAKEKPSSPIGIAREALRRLAACRVAPTPDNYRRLYLEIAGHAPETTEPAAGAEQMLLKLAAELSHGASQPDPISCLITQAVAEKNWDNCKATLIALAGQRTQPPAPTPPWGTLIKNLLKQWEIRRCKITLAKKREGLNCVLKNFASDPAVLGVKLQALIDSWAKPDGNSIGTAGSSAAAANPGTLPSGPAVAGTVAPDLATDSQSARLRQIVGQILEAAANMYLGRHPELAGEARALALQARGAADGEDTAQFVAGLGEFLPKLEGSRQHAAMLQQGLIRLLRLLLKSMHDFTIDNPELGRQIEAVEKLIASPLDAQLIEEVERSLKDLILKQGALKHGLMEIKNTLKSIAARFIDHLGEWSASTGDYHDKIAGYAEQISRTEDIGELNHLLNDVMRETRLIQDSAQSSHDELIAVRKEIEAAQSRIRQLENDLVQVKEKVREDQLTGVLNRRGLDDGFEREAARADRHGFPLCLALLDVDNFKQLNDNYGHQAGDDALVYLTRIIRDTVRPEDIVARFGGEEFLILLPDTTQDEAIAITVRLQRALTRHLFLHNNERMLITFSAGVAQRAAGECKEDLIGRADKALYRAKGSGKNLVVAAP